MYQSMWYAPGMGRGAAGPCIETICYPSVPTDTPVLGVEYMRTSTPMPSVDSEPANSEPSGMAMSDKTGNTSQGSQDQPAPLRHGIHATQNQLPWQYCNFAILADISLPAIQDAWVGRHICLYLISCLCTIFMGSTV